mmetsp:Transcript_20873/g.3376  ORF Transcript_20873/g.3376 Transcript_20873/m.3376 type:complete len:116 (+) Transcript_20873:463-810(+)
MLLPKMIVSRLQGMDVCIGWFLHTPFPSYEVYRMLPYREAVLEGVLSCHLVGFHVAEYVRHFLNACTRILGLLCTDTGVENIGEEMWFCRTSAFAIGIEPDSFSDLLNSEQVLNY